MFESNCHDDKLGFLSPSTGVWMAKRLHRNISNQAICSNSLVSDSLPARIGCLSGSDSLQRLDLLSNRRRFRLNSFEASIYSGSARSFSDHPRCSSYWQIDLYAASTYSSNQRWIRFREQRMLSRKLYLRFFRFLHFVRLILLLSVQHYLTLQMFSNFLI